MAVSREGIMFIGLDLGTSGLKGVLADERQTLIATATAAYPIVNVRPGWSEQDPATWLAAAKQVLDELRARFPNEFKTTIAIGLSGQMHSLVMLDHSHRPVRPAILWNDSRGIDWCDRVILDHPEVSTITGVRPMPSFTAAKLSWIKANEPENFARISQIVLPKDYLRLWLTGDMATDASDAAGTQLLDEKTREWSPLVLSLLSLDAERLPKVMEGSDIGGRLRPEIADLFGVGQIPVIVGGGDAATSALGTGCVDPGASMISLGTGAVYLGARASYTSSSDDSIHYFAHCLPDRWYQMAALLNCGSALDWVCRLTGMSDTPAAINAVGARTNGPSALMFLPYLDGTRTPYCDPSIRGALFGLDRAASPDDLVHTVLEGVTYSLADADRALLAAGETGMSPILIGGGTKSMYWCRLIATVFGRPVRRAVAAESGSALGAVRLAMLGVGFGTLAEIARPPNSETIEPETAWIDEYQERLQKFREMHASAKAYS
jgi:xylulokinase